MREIKFRAWNIKTKIFAENVFLYPNEKKVMQFDSPFYKEYILMQYTGLKDKNGKEIYEGDLLVIAGRLSNPKAVEWYENGFYLSGILHSQIDEDCLIVGNIYENPDLIK